MVTEQTCSCVVNAESLPAPSRKQQKFRKSRLVFAKGFALGSEQLQGKSAGARVEQPEINRLLVRSASNAYFPQVLSVISIPDRDSLLRKAIDVVWDHYLLYVESLEDLQRERRKAKVFAVLQDYPDEKIFAEIQRRKGGKEEEKKSIKQAEFEMLQLSQTEIGDDLPDGDFFARSVALKEPRIG